jgi:hypothetical protein
MTPDDVYKLSMAAGVIISALVSAGTFIRTGRAAQRAEHAAVMAATHAQAATAKIDNVANDVHKVELATNSMKDALIVSTALASDLAGEKRGRENEAARQAASEPKRDT